MGVFQFFKIVHMVLNRATHHICIVSKILEGIHVVYAKKKLEVIQYFVMAISIESTRHPLVIRVTWKFVLVIAVRDLLDFAD